MTQFSPENYRERIRGGGLECFRIRIRQTDLLVRAERKLEKEAAALVQEGRLQIEKYIERNPSFATTLEPWCADPTAPALIAEMISAGCRAGVGPMAAVAGAVAEYVGFGLLCHSGQVIVENGGDIYIKTDRPVTAAVLAGDSPLSGRVGIRILPDATPLGVCCSSGRVGHSLSRGRADAACIVSRSTALADAAATALGNLVSGPRDLKRAAESMSGFEGVAGGVIIAGSQMAAWGEIDLVSL
ncbi:MAG: UPF0280 family protein [Desulfatiglandaceae bacterium]